MSIPTASILLIGNELLNGDTRDKNANYLALKLSELGVALQGVSIVKDNLEDIVSELDRLSNFSKTIFTSGGIGPTSDDITREAIAMLISLGLSHKNKTKGSKNIEKDPLCHSEQYLENLERREESVLKLEDYMKKHNRPLNKNSYKQALFPKGSIIIPNIAGTADAFLTKYNNSNIITLPGVPREVESIFEKEIEPNITSYFSSLRKSKQKNLRIFGLSESLIGTEIDSLKLDVSIAYRPSFPELLLVLSSENEEKLESANSKIINKIGEEFFYSREKKQRLPSAVFNLLDQNNLSLSFAESCTGGLLSESIVSIAGASRVFKGAIISYSNESKEQLLEVDSIKSSGAVSEQTAKQMAKAARDKFNTDYALSVTGIAGPNGGSKEKPVGTVYIAIANKEGQQAYRFQFNWGRQKNRIYSTSMAWDLLRRNILGLAMTWEKK